MVPAAAGGGRADRGSGIDAGCRHSWFRPCLRQILTVRRSSPSENEIQARSETTRADENLLRAQGAETTAQHDLARALLAQARLASKSRLPGQRFETLEALGKVRQIEGPSRKLADEAVAALCLPDLVAAQQWPGAPQGCFTVAFTPLLDIYARCDVDGNISVRRVAGDTEIAAFRTGHRVRDYSRLGIQSGRTIPACDDLQRSGGIAAVPHRCHARDDHS